MSVPNLKTIICALAFIMLLYFAPGAQETVYNNFGPGHEGWDYNFGLGWTVAGDSVANQYSVEQAMQFQSDIDGMVTDVWVAFFYVPTSPPPDTVTIRLAANPNAAPPVPEDILEEWTITEFESWDQWHPPIHLQGSNVALLEEGKTYWLWASGGETTWCGWCVNINPALTCPHTLRREGEDWLEILEETASAFRIDVDPSIDIRQFDNDIPHSHSLSKNYPNPFNSRTAIKYDLSYAGAVTIDIYNLLGGKIETLVNSVQEAGEHSVVWNADAYSSGTYFYSIKTGEYSETHKMTLVK